MNRLPDHATNLDEITRYFTNRARQGLASGWRWSGEISPTRHASEIWGARTLTTSPDGIEHQSLYVLDAHTGRGHFSRYIAAESLPIVTAPSCAIESFLEAREIPFRVEGRFTETTEYRAVAHFYGDRRAARSGVFYMNHIDEGLGVLARIGASDAAWRGYCLHPLVQLDEDLATNIERMPEFASSPHVLALAMEYRNIANAHLSPREEAMPGAPIALSPLQEVNDMLRADKVQNYKDFLLHHTQTHPRSETLQRYFHRWFDRLGISAEFVDELRKWLDVDSRVHVTEPIER